MSSHVLHAPWTNISIGTTIFKFYPIWTEVNIRKMKFCFVFFGLSKYPQGKGFVFVFLVE